MYTKLCATLSKLCLVLAVIGLIGVILCVQWQVIGRYVFNDTPTWAEALALVLVLFEIGRASCRERVSPRV